MIIYLAELSHTGVGRSPNVVPLASGYLAAFAKKHFPDIEITIFRDPNLLLREVKARKPDIVGFSIYVWSERLSNFCAQRVKEICKDAVVVAGGPSVDDIDTELLRFLKLHTYYDVCVPNEGEISFIKLIEHIRENGRLASDATIEGCARLASDGSLLRGSYTAPELSDIPSPYLEGILDTFLEDGYDPVIQSMRGCPYYCTFCVSGSESWSKLRSFDLKRVFAEFDYIKKRAINKYLILTDENFGILKDRDVKFAEYIIKSSVDSGFPSRIYFYSAKIVTDHVLKIVELLAPIGELGISLEALDDAVIKEISLTNIKYDQFLEYVRWAERKNILMSTEMIFGFPLQTADNYIKNLERLLTSGIDRIYSYNLRLLSGIDLSTKASRDKYAFKTMYRLPERTFGCYDGVVITETEEVVVGGNSFDYDDYQKIRRYCLFLELSSGRGYFSELIRLMIKLGLPGEKLVAFFAEHKFAQYPRLSSIINDYATRANEELFETPEACTKYVRDLISGGEPVPETKLNYIYTGKVMLDGKARKELFEVVKEFIRMYSSSAKDINFLFSYIDTILDKQIVSFDPNEKAIVEGESKIRIDRIIRNDYESIDDLLADNDKAVNFVLHDIARDFIKKETLSSVDDEATVQDIYMTVNRSALLRSCTAK